MRRGLELGSGGAQAQRYIQTCLQREAYGEAAIIPTPEELKQILTGLKYRARMLVQASFTSFKECRALEECAATILSADGFATDDVDEEREGESIGIQLSPSQFEDFLKTSARVEMGALESDEVECSICKLEYGTYRGEETNNTEPALDQGLPGEGISEQPVKLPCGHLFGEWCIKIWLLEQLASCPICRIQFKPVVQRIR